MADPKATSGKIRKTQLRSASVFALMSRAVMRKTMISSNSKLWLVFLGMLGLNLITLDYAFSQTPFYQGKTIRMIQGSPAGGTGDLRVKATIPFLQKYIPGNPVIVNEYITGAGGKKAANYLYGTARPDGLTIGSPGSTFVPSAVLGETGVGYDIDKFFYLGSPNGKTNYVLFTRKEVGLDTIEKLSQSVGVRFGAHSVGHSVYVRGRVFAWVLGLRDPKFVTGYSGPELIQAIELGEFDAQAYNADIFVQRLKHWVEKRLMHFHVVDEIPRGYRFPHPTFDSLPGLDKFVNTDRKRKLVDMHRNFTLIGSPFILPPGTPKEQVQILSEAMSKTFRDREFAVNFQKLTSADPSPLFPEEQTKAIKEIPRDSETTDLFKMISGGGPLPKT
jgi:tripartite-type tricarboxylate transporter receptor subunit TctC